MLYTTYWHYKGFSTFQCQKIDVAMKSVVHDEGLFTCTVFTARRYANVIYAMALCPSVCLSARPCVYPSEDKRT